MSRTVFDRKPLLTFEQQISHLKEKGVRFELAYDEAAALDYLKHHNNYFRVSAYRDSFLKYESGARAGTYRSLDFAHLVDLAIIDFELRRVLLSLTLDIEHYTKEHLLKTILEEDEDGYEIVTDFLDSCDAGERIRIQAPSSIYSRDLYAKYSEDMPVWVLFELLLFHELVAFFQFCRRRFGRKDLNNLADMLHAARSVRNAAAHNSCLINDLRTKDRKQPIFRISAKVGSVKGIGKQERITKMANPRIREIVTTLYLHRELVTSAGIRRHTAAELQRIKARFGKRICYDDQPIVGTTFVFLGKLIDAWFPSPLTPT
ncbi:MAG TPA: Abi family protein [Clostridiaceae bacterium]|nr:Abi family protein [Clostridiaceae bacterium]